MNHHLVKEDAVIDQGTHCVYAFKPRRHEPPRFLAETRAELAELADSGELVSYEQCDNCGNPAYKVERTKAFFVVVCTEDPDDEVSHQFGGCGARYPITSEREDDVCF